MIAHTHHPTTRDPQQDSWSKVIILGCISEVEASQEHRKPFLKRKKKVPEQVKVHEQLDTHVHSTVPSKD